jgi:imidazolonepropionase-like amidohydrolase
LSTAQDVQVTAIRAGHLVDTASGTATPDQIILIERDNARGRGTIVAIGSDIEIPDGADVIDLSDHYVLGGLVDAHDHLAITYKEDPESNNYYFTTLMDSTPIRAIQAFSTGFQKLSSGFTIVRDLGNNGLYADTALRQAIAQGWVPGPTIINSGIIIGAFGGQFYEIPEREDTVYPEYLNADTDDEIVKAIRRNIHYGAKVIKVCVDCQAYPYTTEQLKLFVSEAANAGQKVSGHVQTREGALRAIEAGLWSIDHDNAMDPEIHAMMAAKGVWRVGTETPKADWSRVSDARWERRTAMLRDAYDQGVKLAFSTDADYFIPGLHRGELTIEFLETWKAAGIPDADILKIMTTNGYEISELEDERGPVREGFAADIIAVPANPLEDIDALRNVTFVMKDGLVFKHNGIVAPMDFFHNGPQYGWRVR